MPTLSLWLEPAPRAALEISSAINHLATQLDAQPFVPHVTIIGGFQAEEKTAAQQAKVLATSSRPLEITFDALGFEDVIVRAAYLKAVLSPALVELRTHAGELFNLPPDEYSPHMSLVYSKTISEDVRRSAVNKLDIALPKTVRFDKVTLWRTELDLANPDFSPWFKITEIPLIQRPSHR